MQSCDNYVGFTLSLLSNQLIDNPRSYLTEDNISSIFYKVRNSSRTGRIFFKKIDFGLKMEKCFSLNDPHSVNQNERQKKKLHHLSALVTQYRKKLKFYEIFYERFREILSAFQLHKYYCVFAEEEEETT
ncbi:hypothetical protein L9F63_015512, partial [Diploptera punctata]